MTDFDLLWSVHLTDIYLCFVTIQHMCACHKFGMWLGYDLGYEDELIKFWFGYTVDQFLT